MRIANLLQPGQLRFVNLCAVLLLCAACAGPRTDGPDGGLNPDMVSRAVSAATALRNRGGRVWCVPFARNASGIEIRGDADTWWRQARGEYARGHKPVVGSVMAFRATNKLPSGHIAVVSQIVSKREIRVHHANWHRNLVSLDMPVIDVSRRNDWSEVRVMTNPGAYGSVYRVNGFISD